MRNGSEAISEAEGMQDYPRHQERFERVFLRQGVEIREARQEDFRRVPVLAYSLMEARLVEPEQGWVFYEVTPPGVMTEGEAMAQRRALEGQPIDRTKI
jgi:hypothetical protein